jgi:hypothetical protein
MITALGPLQGTRIANCLKPGLAKESLFRKHVQRVQQILRLRNGSVLREGQGILGNL